MLRALLLAVVVLSSIVGCASQPSSSGGAGRFITEPGVYQLGDLWLKVESPGDKAMVYGYRWGNGPTLADTATRDTKSGWFLYWLPPNDLWRYDGDKYLVVHKRNMGNMGAVLPLAWDLPVLANAPKEVVERIPEELRPKQGK